MIEVLTNFCKNGKQYKKGDLVTFSEHDEKRLVDSPFAKYPTKKIKRKKK